MDVQLKRGLLDVCVLTAIKNEDSYGYKIIRDVMPYIEMSESTLYTIKTSGSFIDVDSSKWRIWR